MGLFDFFKKKNTYWHSFISYLTKDCVIAFNTLMPLEERCEKIANEVINGEKKQFYLENINEDDIPLIQTGISAKLADQKFSIVLWVQNDQEEQEQTELLSLWAKDNKLITISQQQEEIKKGKTIFINLYSACNQKINGDSIYILNSQKNMVV